jgi:hypothetical protein
MPEWLNVANYTRAGGEGGLFSVERGSRLRKNKRLRPVFGSSTQAGAPRYAELATFATCTTGGHVELATCEDREGAFARNRRKDTFCGTLNRPQSMRQRAR